MTLCCPVRLARKPSGHALRKLYPNRMAVREWSGPKMMQPLSDFSYLLCGSQRVADWPVHAGLLRPSSGGGGVDAADSHSPPPPTAPCAPLSGPRVGRPYDVGPVGTCSAAVTELPRSCARAHRWRGGRHRLALGRGPGEALLNRRVRVVRDSGQGWGTNLNPGESRQAYT